MEVTVIMLLFVLIVLGVGGFVTVKVLAATDPSSQGEQLKEEVDSAQAFIPFEDIRDSMICLGNHRYRAVIECSSINYMLKTEKEREIIEHTFQRFLSSVTFPISFHIQTKKIDNTEIVRSLEKDISELEIEGGFVTDYAKRYLESMKSFDTYLANSKQKKKYIIVNYDDAFDMGDLSDKEKEELSRQQLNDRVEFVKGQITSIGISAERLDTKGLIAMLYRTYYREEVQYDMEEAISNGIYFDPIVKGELKSIKQTPEERVDLELTQIQKIIKEEYLDMSLGIDNEQYKKMSELYNHLDDVRATIGKPFGGAFRAVTGESYNDKVRTSGVNLKVKTDKNYIENQNFIPANISHVNSEEYEPSFDYDSSKNNEFSFDFEEESESKDARFSFDFEEESESKDDRFSFDFEEESESKDDGFSFDFEEESESKDAGFSFDFEEESESKDAGFSFDFENNNKTKLDELFEQDDFLI